MYIILLPNLSSEFSQGKKIKHFLFLDFNREKKRECMPEHIDGKRDSRDQTRDLVLENQHFASYITSWPMGQYFLIEK